MAKPSLLQDYMEKYGNAGIRRRNEIALRAAKIEAELAFKARGTFLESMNHELRTPLNAIFGFGSMLKNADGYRLDPDKAKEYVTYILSSAELLLAHIDILLELAAVESGGAKMEFRRSNIAQILREVLEASRSSVEEKGVHLDLLIDPDIPDSKIDADRISCAYKHILNGALGQCKMGDRISVICKASEVTNANRWIYSAISDTGPGISPEEIDRSMRMFDQVHQWLNREIDGLGLGLPIARSFTEMNKGKFSIHSSDGTGTIIRMAFPALEMQEQQNLEVCDTAHHSPSVIRNAG